MADDVVRPATEGSCTALNLFLKGLVVMHDAVECVIAVALRVALEVAAHSLLEVAPFTELEVSVEFVTTEALLCTYFVVNLPFSDSIF